MKTPKPQLALALLLGCAAFGAHACELQNQKVIEVMTDDVGTYDEKGAWVADVKKAEIPLGQTILQCKDTPAMVQVELTPDASGNKRTAWVTLLEVKVGAGGARKCKDTAISRVTDTTVPATSGIDPCSNAKK